MTSRRSFLRFMGIGAAMASSSTYIGGLLDEAPLEVDVFTHTPISAGDWVIDSATKKIIYDGPQHNVVSVNELYSFIQNAFDEPELLGERNAMMAITPEIYEMQNDWVIDEDAFSHLNNASLKQGEDFFASVVMLGNPFEHVPSLAIPVVANSITKTSQATQAIQYQEMMRITPDIRDIVFTDPAEIMRPFTTKITCGVNFPFTGGVIRVPHPMMNLYDTPRSAIKKYYGSERATLFGCDDEMHRMREIIRNNAKRPPKPNMVNLTVSA